MQELGRTLFKENMKKKLAKKPWIAEKRKCHSVLLVFLPSRAILTNHWSFLARVQFHGDVSAPQ